MKNLENSEKLGTVWVAKASFAAKKKQKHPSGLSSNSAGSANGLYHIFAVKRDAPIYTFLKNGS